MCTIIPFKKLFLRPVHKSRTNRAQTFHIVEKRGLVSQVSNSRHPGPIWVQIAKIATTTRTMTDSQFPTRGLHSRHVAETQRRPEK